MEPKVIKIRITSENIDQFYYVDNRINTPIFKKDKIQLEKKLLKFVKGEKTELTKKYPERYDLTVFTYSQNKPPIMINDGCHRMEALKNLFKKGKIEYFDAWLIPSNILGAYTKQEALELNERVNEELKRAALPLWIKKFDFELRGEKLIAWKNLNLIDTGGEDTRKQYGVDWFLNDDPDIHRVDLHTYKNKYRDI